MGKYAGAVVFLLLLTSILHSQQPEQCSSVELTCTGCIRTSLTLVEVQQGYAKALLIGQYTVTHAEIDEDCITNPTPECQELISLSCYADGEPVSFYYNDGSDGEFHELGSCQNVLTSQEGTAECSFSLPAGVYIIKGVYNGNSEMLSASSERTVKIGSSSVVGAVAQNILNSLSQMMVVNPAICIASVFLGGALFASMFASGIDPLRYFDIASPRIRKKKRYVASKGSRGYEQRKMRMNWGKISGEISEEVRKALAIFGLRLSNAELRDLMFGSKGVMNQAVLNRWNKNRILDEMLNEIERRLGRRLHQAERDALDPLLSMYYAVMMADPGRRLAQKEQEPSRNPVAGFFTSRFRNLVEGITGRIPLTANVYFDAIRSGSRFIREFKRMIKVRLATAPQLTLGVMGFLGARDFKQRVEQERAKIADESYRREPHPIKDFVRAVSQGSRRDRLARAMAYLSYPGSKESAGGGMSSLLRFMDVVSLHEARYHQWMREGYQSVYFYALARIFKEKLGINPEDLAKILDLIVKDSKGNLVVNLEAIAGLRGASASQISAIFLLARHQNSLVGILHGIDPNNIKPEQLEALERRLRELNIFLHPAYFISAYSHLLRNGLLNDIEAIQRTLNRISFIFREAYERSNNEYQSNKIDSVEALTREEQLRAALLLSLLKKINIDADVRVSLFFNTLNSIHRDSRPQSLKTNDLYEFLSRNCFYQPTLSLFGSTGSNDFYHFLMEKDPAKSNYQFFFFKEYAAQLGHLARGGEEEIRIYSNKAEFAAIAATSLRALNELFGLGSRNITTAVQAFILDMMNTLRRVGSNPLQNYAEAIQALFPQWRIEDMVRSGGLQLTNVFSRPLEAMATSSESLGKLISDALGARGRGVFASLRKEGMDRNISEVLRGNIFRGIQAEAANNALWAFDMRGHWKLSGDRSKVAAIETVARAYDSPHRPGPDTPEARLALIKELFLENMLSVFARGDITSFGTNWRTNFEKADLMFFNALARYYARTMGEEKLDDASVRNYVAQHHNEFHQFLLNTRINPLTLDQSTPWIMARGVSFVPYEKGMSLSIFDGISGARLMFKDKDGNFRVLDPSFKTFSRSVTDELGRRLAEADPSLFQNSRTALVNATQRMTFDKEGFKEHMKQLLEGGRISAYDLALLSFYMQHSGHHTGLLDILRADDYRMVTVKGMVGEQAQMGGWEGAKGRLKQIGYGLLESLLARSIYTSAPRLEQHTDLLVGSSLLLYEGRQAAAKMFEQMQRHGEYLNNQKLAGIYSELLDKYMKFEGGWDYAITRDPRLHVPSMEGEERITHGYFQVGPALPFPSEVHWKTFQDEIEWRYSGPMLGRISKLAQLIAKPFIMASRLSSYIGGGYPSPKSLGYLVDSNGNVIEPDTLQPFPYSGSRLVGRFRTMLETLLTPSSWMTGPSLDPLYYFRRLAYWFGGEAREPSSGSGEGGSRFKRWGYGGEEVIYGAPRPHQFVSSFYNPAVYNIWQAMANPGHSYFDALGRYRLNPQILLWATRLYGVMPGERMEREGQKVFMPLSRELLHEANAPIFRREVPGPEVLFKTRYDLSYYSLSEGTLNRIITGGAIWNLSREERKRESWRYSLGLGLSPAIFAGLPAFAGVGAIYRGVRSARPFEESIRDEYRELIRGEALHEFCPRCGMRTTRGVCLHGHSAPLSSS